MMWQVTKDHEYCRSSRLIIGIVFIIAFLYLLPGFSVISKSTFWAFSVNAYIPQWVRIINILLVAVSLTIVLLPRLVKPVTKIPVTIQYFLFSAMLIAGSIILKETVPLYGDGYFFQRTIETQVVKFTQVLSIIFYRAVSYLLPESTFRGAQVYRMVNTALVLPATLIFLLFARRLPKEHMPFFLLMILGLGANVLFFGHIENYTLCFVIILLYFYCITHTRPNTLILSLILGISISLHALAICLVPSCVYVVLKYRDKMSTVTAIVRMIVFLVMPVVATVLFASVIGISPRRLLADIISSFIETKGHTLGGFFTSMFAWYHWLDIINLFFLSMPIIPILLYLLVRLQKQKSGKQIDFRLLCLLVVPFILFLIIFSSPLGLARDWDLGLTAMVWVVIALYFYCRWTTRKQHRSPEVLISLALLSFSLQVPWFFIHRYTDHAVERYENILEAYHELPATAYGYEILGRYYHDEGIYPKSLEAYKAAAMYEPDNYRHFRNVAMESMNTGDITGAIENLRRAYDHSPQEVSILVDLAEIYHGIGSDSMALSTLQEVYAVDSVSLKSQFNLGCAYYWNAEYDMARQIFERILKKEPGHYHTLMALVDVAIGAGDIQQATQILDTVVSLHGIDDIVRQKRSMMRQMMIK